MLFLNYDISTIDPSVLEGVNFPELDEFDSRFERESFTNEELKFFEEKEGGKR